MRHSIPLDALPAEVLAKLIRKQGTAPFVGCTMAVPFAQLVSDNGGRKYGARAVRTANGGYRAAMFLAAPYRAAKDALQQRARLAMGHQKITGDPVRLTVQLWYPDLRRRDMLNYAKLLCDAMKGVVFQDDSQIVSAEWLVVGVDKQQPRALVTVVPQQP